MAREYERPVREKMEELSFHHLDVMGGPGVYKVGRACHDAAHGGGLYDTAEATISTVAHCASISTLLHAQVGGLPLWKAALYFNAVVPALLGLWLVFSPAAALAWAARTWMGGAKLAAAGYLMQLEVVKAPIQALGAMMALEAFICARAAITNNVEARGAREYNGVQTTHQIAGGKKGDAQRSTHALHCSAGRLRHRVRDAGLGAAAVVGDRHRRHAAQDPHSVHRWEPSCSLQARAAALKQRHQSR
jgi:hypothetical protein